MYLDFDSCIAETDFLNHLPLDKLIPSLRLDFNHTQYLDSGLAEPEPLAELLPHESIWIVGLIEQLLQFSQLLHTATKII